MTKPMYCPMSFGDPSRMKPMECTPDCGAAVFDFKNGCYACGLVEANTLGVVGNWRPLKDDAE